jgi:NAD+ synthase (glutamine-hydrolysing)
MQRHGFARVAAATPRLRVADCAFNAGHILGLFDQAQEAQVDVLVFPELAITGYTCADLFQQLTLLAGAAEALVQLAREGASRFSGLAIVGLPLAVDDQVFNCAAVIHRGRVLGMVPKSFIPNYKEFYEGRWFAAAAARGREVMVGREAVPFATDQLFDATDVDGLIVGVEICEDLWMPIPPSSYQAVRGATILANLSASNEVIGKAPYRRELVVNQSGRCVAGYVYASCGVWESTTDVVFGGHCLIAENGTLLAESARFQRSESLLCADIDLDRLRVDRMRMTSFGNASLYAGTPREFTRVRFALEAASSFGFAAKPNSTARKLLRTVDPHPFVPSGNDRLRERCEEVFQIQVSGLAQRLEHVNPPRLALGISGGLDSTLALLVACKTLDAIHMPRRTLHAMTMPGFGTTQRTLANAKALMGQLGVTGREIDIRELCLDEMRAMGHRPFGQSLDDTSVDGFVRRLRGLKDGARDVVFENVQARVRTNLLMNIGFTIGTGDLSELALGWTTFNGDHISMYNPNAGVPKTLVKFLVAWAAENEFEGETRRTLLDIVATDISPELLPAAETGEITQLTEASIGPYELHDFFLFHVLRHAVPPEKLLFLAEQARFDVPYSTAAIRRWLAVFYKRFFANQFKRSCMPDGPKVGSVSLSPRGDWRMPSDASAALWLKWAEDCEASANSRLAETAIHSSK